MTKVSIIMGIYNCEKYLKDSIESIINQTYKDWELIMCDDCSTDNTYAVASKYTKYPNIKLLKNDKNMGLNYTLNKCLRESKGKYIARQDGDDISLKTRLEKEVDFLDKNKDFALISCNMNMFDDNGIWGRTHKKEVVKKEDFIVVSPFNHASCMIRKEVLDEVKGYSVDKKLLRVEDYHLWFKIYINGYKGGHLSECLYNARDDKNAYKRRNFKNRLNETRLKFWGFRKLKIKLKYYIYILRPIIVYFLPLKIYDKFHKKNLKKEN